MINHARTLLLNMPAKKARRDATSYEYVPPAFNPIQLSGPLTTIRAALFGAAPDNYFLNFRVRELLRYIHETELAHYVYALDNRVTYWPEYDVVDFTATKQITLTQTAGPPRRISVAGQFDVNNATGRAARQYVITLAPGDVSTFSANVTALNESPAIAATTEFADLTNAPIIAVPQTNLKLRFSNIGSYAAPACDVITELGDMLIVEDYDSAALITLESDADCSGALPFRMRSTEPPFPLSQWVLTARARPPAAITTIMPILELLGEPVALALFGVSPTVPYATFKHLWLDHPLPAYKLAGLVLAFIYRCNEIYENKNA